MFQRVSCSQRVDETVYLNYGTDQKIRASFDDDLARPTMATVDSDVSLEWRLQWPCCSSFLFPMLMRRDLLRGGLLAEEFVELTPGQSGLLLLRLRFSTRKAQVGGVGRVAPHRPTGCGPVR